MTKPKIVSLFSGAGGLDLGFSEEGFQLVFAVDNSQWAIKTHKRNFKKTVSITANLIELQPVGVIKELANILTPGEPIGIIGGLRVRDFRGRIQQLSLQIPVISFLSST